MLNGMDMETNSHCYSSESLALDHFDLLELLRVHNAREGQTRQVATGVKNDSLKSDDFSLVTPRWETTKMTTPKSLFWPSEAQTDYQKVVIVTVLVTCGGDALNNCIT
jgi:hypothetical protein